MVLGLLGLLLLELGLCLCLGLGQCLCLGQCGWWKCRARHAQAGACSRSWRKHWAWPLGSGLRGRGWLSSRQQWSKH